MTTAENNIDLLETVKLFNDKLVIEIKDKEVFKVLFDAAEKINGLIDSSTRQVKDGSLLAQKAGQAITELAQTVQQVSSVMDELSGASVEQKTGIEEINRAVALLDESTQQNAALVEQSAAAAQSLDEQAQALDQLVGRFDLKAV